MLIKNADNKTVCEVIEDKNTVIIIKGRCKTIIKLNKDGKPDIKHTRIGDKEYEKRRA